MAITCQFMDDLPRGWADTPSLTIHAAGKNAMLRVGVLREASPALLVEIHDDFGGMPCRDARVMGEVLLIGGLCHLHAIALSDPPRLLRSIRISHYFSRCYVPHELDAPTDAFDVLAVGCSEVIRFNRAGDVVWIVSNLAIDGIVLHRVENGRIRGDAEWDPPGGWEPFELDVLSGDVLVSPASRMR
jgi:hypothetical protein